MKAIIQDRYGPPDAVLSLREIETPAIRDDEVLVRVRAASVHPDVWHAVYGWPYVLRLMGSGLRRPKYPIPGTDVAGTVDAVGRSVTRFQPGDAVFGETLRSHQWRNGGAFAEYVPVAEQHLASKPGNVTFEQAAAVPTAGLILLLNVRDAQLLPGHHVLVNGAGGGVGALAVQLAKARGATVTGVDSAAKRDLVGSLGADRVLDYAEQDYTRAGDRYDLIIDIPGGRPFADCRRALKPDGTYILIGHNQYGWVGSRVWGSLPRFFGLMVRSPFVKQLPSPDFSTPDKGAHLAQLAELLAAGKVAPVVGRSFPLADAAAAIECLAAGDTVGKIIIAV